MMLRGWIPPIPLALAQCAFGASWIVLFAVAGTGEIGISPLALGWVHLVALGWITLAALTILIHVIPGFTGLELRSETVMRRCLLVFAAGAAFLVSGFILTSMPVLETGAAVTLAAILIYVTLASLALRPAFTGERVMRAVARAFIITFLFLLVTAFLGLLFAGALAGHVSALTLVHLPSAHALLGIGGWLTILTVGVSARTTQPIMGTRSRYVALHIVSASALLAGTLAAAAGAAVANAAVSFAGLAMIAAGAIAYALDMVDIARRATVPHRPPQVFMLCAAFFGTLSVALAIGSVFGLNVGAAAVYCAFIGGIGNAVIAHFHHIGVRVLLTSTLGEEDVTRPGAVLTPMVTWVTVILYESAAVLGTLAIVLSRPAALEAAAVCGFSAWFAMTLNGVRARKAALRMRPLVEVEIA